MWQDRSRCARRPFFQKKTAAIMAASQVQEENQNEDTAEELQTGAEDFLNIKAFHLQEVEESLADLEEESSFRFADTLKSLIREKSR